VAGYPHTLFSRTGHPANDPQPERIGRGEFRPRCSRSPTTRSAKSQMLGPVDEPGRWCPLSAGYEAKRTSVVTWPSVAIYE
jgi:hypothetical protein